MAKDIQAEVGVFGGSGFYSFLEDTEEIEVKTPYGPPSDKIVMGQVGGKNVAFMPRHGRNHDLPPHMINFRANIYAMKELGVKYLFGPCASGSLQPYVKPGHFVICDQFVDLQYKNILLCRMRCLSMDKTMEDLLTLLS